MKIQVAKVHFISNASLAALETAVNNWMATDTQREFVALQYVYDSFGGVYTVMIAYTE